MRKEEKKPVEAMRDGFGAVLTAYCEGECENHDKCSEGCLIWKLQDWIDGTGKRKKK